MATADKIKPEFFNLDTDDAQRNSFNNTCYYNFHVFFYKDIPAMISIRYSITVKTIK